MKLRRWTCCAVWLSVLQGGSPAYGQTRVDVRTQGKEADFGAYNYTKPFKTGASLPAACAVGEAFFRTGMTPGQNLYLCTAANTWSQMVGTGGGSGQEVLSSNPWTSDGRLVATDGAAGRNVRQIPISYDGMNLVIPGGLSVGSGVSTGLQWTLGNPGDTGASSLVIRGGDGTANSEPGYLSAFSSHPSSPFQSFLFPCGSAGKWCASALTPGADSTDHLLSVANVVTVQNKTLDETNAFSGSTDWTQTATPSANPSAGVVRVYAKTGAGICWKDSAGAETCAGAGGGGGGLSDPGTNGLVARTALNTTAARTITGVSGEIVVTNGDGAADNPQIGLAETVDLSGKTATLPVKAGPSSATPASCAANRELYIKTDATAGQQLFICNSAGAGWVLVGDGGGPADAAYITQTPDSRLSNEQALSTLATGLLKNVTGTGVLSIATGADLPAHSHAASDLASGALADARVAESNVTQHQAALSLAATQIASGTLADARVAQSNVTQHQAALSLAATQITSGTLGLDRGGTNQASWTAGRCVQVSADGSTLESASGACAGAGAPVAGDWIGVTDSTVYFRPNPRQFFSLNEEFIGGAASTSPYIGELGWGLSTGGSTSRGTEAGEPGYITRDTGGTSGTVVSIFLNHTSSGGGSLTLNANEWRAYFRVRANHTTQIKLRIGFTNYPQNDPGSQGIYFQNVSGASGSNWTAVTRSSPNEQSTDTTVVLDTSWHMFEIRRNGSSIEFYIDGTLRATNSQYIPSSSMMPFLQVVNQEAASKSSDTGLFTFWMRITR